MVGPEEVKVKAGEQGRNHQEDTQYSGTCGPVLCSNWQEDGEETLHRHDGDDPPRALPVPEDEEPETGSSRFETKVKERKQEIQGFKQGVQEFKP